MTLAALKDTLDALEERSYCEGTCRITERLAIALPDGDVSAADDATFVAWLTAHSEAAPFGEAKLTKIDVRVRHALRLVARGKADIAGFDPADVLDQIEAALSPRMHLAATLTDVLVYPAGGKFERHKDTPRSPELVGTLVVGLPIEHAGGTFRVTDGRGTKDFDWSGTPDPETLRWVALFSDVDHEIAQVTSGARVTLVYALHATERPRVDPTWEARRARLRAAAGELASEREWPVMIACTRHVITENQAQPPVKVLRGLDRDIADAFVDAGYDVTVRACVAACPSDGESQRFPDVGEMYAVQRLDKPLTPKVIASLDEVVTFSDEAEDDEGGDLAAFSLAPYILDEVNLEQWVIRANAAATMIHEALFSDTGYFGNEAYEACIYTLAALEVTPR
jgi:hypothetical protein